MTHYKVTFRKDGIPFFEHSEPLGTEPSKALHNGEAFRQLRKAHPDIDLFDDGISITFDKG